MTPISKTRAPFLNHVIKNHFPSDRSSTVIDLGCGSGDLILCARESGYRNIQGADRSPAQLKRAEERGIHIEQTDALTAAQALEPNSVDLIVTFDVIEHLHKDELLTLSHAIYQALKPEGRWLIHTVNAESPFFGRIRYGDLTHEQGFTQQSVTQLLHPQGFKKIKCLEDKPIVHGIKSALRRILWQIFRSVLRLYLATETGETNGIFSQNFIILADKN